MKECDLISIQGKEECDTIYERILDEDKRLEQQIRDIEKHLKKMPEGKFVCTKNGNRYKWYQSDLHTQTYIPKKKRKLAEKLATKKYLLSLLEDLKHERLAIQFYLRHHSKETRAEELLQKCPEIQRLLLPYFKPMSQELSEWKKESYKSNPTYPEQLIHKSISGNMLRSKSEVMIDMSLYKHKIPFRYEEEIELEGTILHPDFTVRHPKTGETYYWEHFGLMDNPSYAQSAFAKMNLYTSQGIIPSVNLITTFETKEHPLSIETIENIIGQYFL